MATRSEVNPGFRPALLAWFDRHKRDLPWRRTRDAYAIWLSEVMLQQTQVQTVIPYWERFLQRFPTVEALASAPLDEVFSLWRGLGYYARARNLHRAAAAIVAAGGFPKTAEALRELPGFGPYTAGAVASIAFEEEAAIVDGNVARVFSRLFLVDGAPGERAREARLWALARETVRGPRPGDYNQALMELGALVCRKDAPTCLLCPVRAFCGALQQGRVDRLPPTRKRPARKHLSLAVAALNRRGRWLIGRRAQGGLFRGLWELPNVSAEEGAAASALRDLLGAVKIGEEVARVERTLTHRDLVLRLHKVTGPAPRQIDGYDTLRWATQKEFGTIGMSTAMQKLVAHLSLSIPASADRRLPRRRTT